MKKKLKNLGLWLVNVVLASIYFLALVLATIVVGSMYIVASLLILIWRGLSWCWNSLQPGIEPVS